MLGHWFSSSVGLIARILWMPLGDFEVVGVGVVFGGLFDFGPYLGWKLHLKDSKITIGGRLGHL